MRDGRRTGRWKANGGLWAYGGGGGTFFAFFFFLVAFLGPVGMGMPLMEVIDGGVTVPGVMLRGPVGGVKDWGGGVLEGMVGWGVVVKPMNC